MSIASIHGVGRVSTSGAGTPAPAVAGRSGTALSEIEIDALTQRPVPPRFPWLSRLSLQLEAAAKQRPAFPPAPVLGDRLDQSA